MSDPSTGERKDPSYDHRSRREFLGALGVATATAVGGPGVAEAQESPVVAMESNQFDPVGLHVEPGTTVRFEIGTGSHSATAYRDRIPSEAAFFDSGTMSEGAFEWTFETAGTYDYYCVPHQSMGMVGRIVVGEPGGPAEATPIPDGDVPASEAIVEQGTVGIDEFDQSGGGHEKGVRSGPGIMEDGKPGWMLFVPIGFVTTLLALVGGVSYWASRRGAPDTDRGASAMSILEKQYARGDIDEDEFQRRRDQLHREE